MRFVLNGGKVYSINDGNIHYISSEQLRVLYNLNKNDCIIVDDYILPIYLEPFNILLEPRIMGDYKEYLNEKIKESIDNCYDI